MHDVIALDATAMKNLFAVLDNCKEKGIRLVVSHVEPQPLAAMKRAGFLNALGEENIFDNIDEAISELSKAEKDA